MLNSVARHALLPLRRVHWLRGWSTWIAVRRWPRTRTGRKRRAARSGDRHVGGLSDVFLRRWPSHALRVSAGRRSGVHCDNSSHEMATPAPVSGPSSRRPLPAHVADSHRTGSDDWRQSGDTAADAQRAARVAGREAGTEAETVSRESPRVGTPLTKGSRADLALDCHYRHCCASRPWLLSPETFWVASRAAWLRFASRFAGPSQARPVECGPPRIRSSTTALTLVNVAAVGVTLWD